MEIINITNYESKDFIQTPTGVKVSRSALMCSPEQVGMPGGKVIQFIFILFFLFFLILFLFYFYF